MQQAPVVISNRAASLTATLRYYYTTVYPAKFMCSLLRRATGYTAPSPECLLMLTNGDVANRMVARTPQHLVRILCGEELRGEFVNQPAANGLHARPRRRESAITALASLDERDNVSEPFPFVIDYDVDAVTPPARMCKCVGKALCGECWQALACSVKLADWVLRRVFQYASVLTVYSGNRGVHVHCYDDAAVRANAAEREALLDHAAYPWRVLIPAMICSFLSADDTRLMYTAVDDFLNSSFRVHAWWHDAYARLVWPHFVQHWTRAQQLNPAQSSCYEHLAKRLRECVATHDRNTLYGCRSSGISPATLRDVADRCLSLQRQINMQRWALDNYLVDELTGESSPDAATTPSRSVPTFQWRVDVCLLVLIFVFVSPDAEVSLRGTHAIRQPFSPHKSTQCLAVPFRAVSAHMFQPHVDSPNVADLYDQRATHESLRAVLDIARESLSSESNASSSSGDYYSNYE